MALESNLNQSPYFDDFNEDKNYHRILFRPGYAVQARELTQIQSILQNQLERFASEVMIDGTVVSGCSVTAKRVPYVRVRDRDANNRLLITSDLINSDGSIKEAIVTGDTTGLNARLVSYKAGTEIAYPNTFTLYVEYIDSGANNTTKEFSENEVLVVKSLASNTFIVSANTYATNATGYGLKASTSDGIIYHKGNFIRVEPQSTIAGRYTTNPDINIGFESKETFVNSYEDSSLNDNATGSTNAGAPGADRLKIRPTLTTRPIGSSNTETFFTVANMKGGKITRRISDTTYSDIGDYVDQKFFETNGNFAVEPFNVRVREHLKTNNNLGRFTSESGYGNNNLLVVGVENGTGYVSGKRIKVGSPVEINVSKATTFETIEDSVIGQAIGSYVIVEEMAGAFDYQGLRVVELHSAAHNAVSSTNGIGTTVQSTKIGEAAIRGVEYHSGVQGSPSGKYRLYLFNIKMNSGQSFTDVKSVIQTGTSSKAFADTVLENSLCVLKDASLTNLVFPLEQGGTKTLKDKDNNVETQWVWKNEKDVVVASDGSATVTANTAHAGGTENNNDTGAPLSTTDERNVIIIATTAAETGNKNGTISAINTTAGVATITGNSTDFTNDYVVGDTITINSESAVITEIVSATSMKAVNDNSQLTNGTGLSHNHKLSVIAGRVFDLSTEGTITSTGSAHTINLGDRLSDLTSSFNASVQFNTLRTDSVPESKVANKNVFVKLVTSNNAATSVGPYPLGVSDAYKLRKVYKAASGVTESSEDVTSHFELITGQTDSHYGPSKVAKKSTSSLDISNCELLVKFDYFYRDRSAGIGFLTVDSYPVDDTDPDAAGNIGTADIPVYISPTTGKRFDLRDSVDFRPYMDRTVTPPTTVGGLIDEDINPDLGDGRFFLDSSGAHMPVPDENFQTAVQFYLPRIDKVVLNSSGRWEVVKGVPSRKPRTPDDKASSMTVATLNVPPYPSLSPYYAKQINRTDYQVRVNVTDNRRYTMKDIRTIDRRVKNVEYYSSLNALELSARNKQLFNDEGLTRFKNGFLVDNFVGHNVADTTKVGYRAAIDKRRSLMRPTFERRDVQFELSETGLTTAGMTSVGGDAGTETMVRNFTTSEYLGQTAASKKRNPVQELMFNWTGEIALSPSMDNMTDINTLPDVQLDYDGMYDSFVELANRTGVIGTDWGAWETTNVDVDVDDTTNSDGSRTITTTTQTDQIREGVTTSFGSPAVQTFDLGTRVTNVAVRDYMRSKPIKFTASRMRPNTRLYAYFDSELVDGYITPTDSSFANTASPGAPLVTNENGVAHGIFIIPNDDDFKFRIGSRQFRLVDVDDLVTEVDIITTSASAEYTSIPIDVDQSRTYMNIRVPKFVDTNVSATQTLTSTEVEEIPAPPPPPPPAPPNDDGPTWGWDDDGNWGWGDFPDPIAQSFSIQAGRSDGIFVSSIDVYFAAKSSSSPITLQVREMQNGLPTQTIVPFGSKTLMPSEVNVNADQPDAKTKFTFDSPLFLANGRDYCFVVLPSGNSDEFLVWTAELGGKDIISGALIDKQPATGIMFTSANNKSWKQHQSEDMAFIINKCDFTTGETSIYLQNKDMEFFNTTDRSGNFQIGEKVLDAPSITLTGVTGNSAGEAIQTGTFFNIKHGAFTANAEVLSVTSDNGSGTVTAKVAANYSRKVWKAAADSSNSTLYTANVVNGGVFSGSGRVDTITFGNGRGFVQYEDTVNGKLHLDDSNGNWSASDIVVGQTSRAYATVDSIYDVAYNSIVPKLPTVVYGNTSVDWTIRTTSTSGVISDAFVAAPNGTTSEYLDGEKKMYSRSNETGLSARDGTSKSIIIKGTLNTTDPNVSPIIDITRMNGLTLHNIINNDATDEHKEVGNAQARHISKVVELADGNDAEDLKVFVNAWRPSGTDVKVYARIHNPEDPEGINEKDFTPMTLATGTSFSDSVRRNDYKELEFSFSANTDGQNFLASASANSHARLNTNDDEVVWYMNSDGSKFRTYKSFSIKIVLTSSSSSVVPLVSDMRAIALQK